MMTAALSSRKTEQEDLYISSSEIIFMGHEKNDNKERVEAEWRMSLRDKKSQFPTSEIRGDIVTSKWKHLIGG